MTETMAIGYVKFTTDVDSECLFLSSQQHSTTLGTALHPGSLCQITLHMAFLDSRYIWMLIMVLLMLAKDLRNLDINHVTKILYWLLSRGGAPGWGALPRVRCGPFRCEKTVTSNWGAGLIKANRRPREWSRCVRCPGYWSRFCFGARSHLLVWTSVCQCPRGVFVAQIYAIPQSISQSPVCAWSL